jgi:hypothetical protein
MDMEVLKKKISTYRTDGGYVKNVPDELLMEILYSWEQWTGPATGFYSAIGVNQKRMASIIGKAKKLKREGHFPAEEFKEIKLDSSTASIIPLSGGPCSGIEMAWDNGKVIRFQQVEQLVDFLKKVA